MKPLEIHKDKGWITNIVPILKPICLFGLKTKIRDTTKIPFLTAEGDKKSFEKSKKQFDVDQIDEFLLPTEKLDLHKLAEGSKNAYIFLGMTKDGSDYTYSKYLGRSSEQMEDDYWSMMLSRKQFMRIQEE